MTLADWLALSALIVAIVAIPITYFLGRRSRQRPDLRYSIDYDDLIVPESSLREQGLTLSLDGLEIERVSRTFVAIWNKRGDPIRAADLAESDPLRLQLQDGDRVLQARVVTVSGIDNGLTIAKSTDGGSAVIQFDFLDQSDGGIVEILHEGDKPELLGTVVGVRPKRISGVSLDSEGRTALGQPWWRRSSKKLLLSLFAIVMVAVVIVFTLPVRQLMKYHDRLLLDPERFDLQTIQGQLDFVRAYIDANGTYVGDDKYLWIISGIYGLLLASAVAIAIVSMVPRLPRYLVAHAIPADAEGKGELTRASDQS